MNLRERQDGFLAEWNALPDRTEQFNYLIALSALLVPECPPSLRPYRIENCQSRTFFRAGVGDGLLRVDGWSNSAIMGGIVVACRQIFDGVSLSDLASAEIDFHIRSGLIDGMTPMRTDSFREIIRRITVLSSPPPDAHLCPPNLK
jgi:sulfur transfer protein SufE